MSKFQFHKQPSGPSGTSGPGPEKKLEHLVRYSIGHWYKCSMIDKRHADGFTEAGICDFSGHIDGKYLELELKVSNNYFSDLQKTRIAKVCRTGAFAAGLLHLRDDDSYWLIPDGIIQHFSYRTKTGWIPLPLLDVNDRDGTHKALNLRGLTALLSINNK